MNDNFLDFITRDISSKKTLITSMPNKTKTNKRKINDTIAEIEKKYLKYKDELKNYLIVKSHSFEIKEDNKEYEKIKDEVIALEQVRFLLNPTNTYIEKLGFDELLYQINNFNKFNFHSLNDIINAFLDKFEIIGIRLKEEDFRVTAFVNEYMNAFLDVRYGIDNKYDKVSEIFERIYWQNPDLIKHIGLNFKIYIRKYSKDFNEYIQRIQKKTKNEYKINGYEDCLDILKNKYGILEKLEEESIAKIMSLALNGNFDINQYDVEHKVRINAFSSVVPDNIDINNKSDMDKLCDILEKLEYNIEEYKKYIKFIPLFSYFKNSYKNLINDKNNKSKDILNDIEKKEKELNNYNKLIFSKKNDFIEKILSKKIEKAKILAGHYVSDLFNLYSKYDEELYKDKVRNIISEDTTLEDVLHLYYSFDYLKKSDIQKAYEINDYNEIIDMGSEFDLYSMNPNNLIVKGVKVFDDYNISQIIANKYKLNNLKIEESDLAEENVQSLYNKIKLILRVNTINNSKSSIEKIWFMVQTKKLLASEVVEEAENDEE